MQDEQHGLSGSVGVSASITRMRVQVVAGLLFPQGLRRRLAKIILYTVGIAAIE